MSRLIADETLYPKRLASIFYTAPRLALAFERCLDLEKRCADKLAEGERRLLEKDGAVELVGVVYLAGVQLHPDIWKDGSIEPMEDGLDSLASEWRLVASESRLLYKGKPLAEAVDGLWSGLRTGTDLTFHHVGTHMRIPMWPNSAFIFMASLTHAAQMMRLHVQKPHVPRPVVSKRATSRRK